MDNCRPPPLPELLESVLDVVVLVEIKAKTVDVVVVVVVVDDTVGAGLRGRT